MWIWWRRIYFRFTENFEVAQEKLSDYQLDVIIDSKSVKNLKTNL